ncbi:autoinducer binding domain-containing protein [Sulfitobacter aestuarii]|uniref:Autoinducer binding domain-containing protein n=1 Tax=Sulfitobacter aestuarii TaxID=2161676 RepID=A0ABW5U393_9RHOB
MVTDPQLEEILAGLERADGRGALQSAILALRKHFAIDHMVYHWVDSGGLQQGCGSYPRAWVSRYQERGYLRVDPVVRGCFQRFQPVDWKRLDWSCRAARAFRAEALRHGLGNQGFTVPVRGPNGQFALFTSNHSCDDESWARFAAKHRRELILIAHDFNQKALEFAPVCQHAPDKALSPRERDAMSLLAVGCSRAQVAARLSISEHTLRAYIESARFKLGALNTTHAVARALSHGLIMV